MSDDPTRCAAARYAGEEIEDIFSRDHKYTLWRRLWIYLAEAQQSLGLEITDRQIEQMKEKVDDIPWDRVKEHEEETRHEVMAHIRTFSEQCPEAGPIIHLGATSMFVMDNADVIMMREALEHIKVLLLNVVEGLKQFAEEWADQPILGMTHLQPAQVTTVGKRACLWLSDFLKDVRNLERINNSLRFRGTKGAIGTQASYLNLFDGDHEKVKKLDRLVAGKAGFDNVQRITGQTYPRKQDSRIMDGLAQVAQTASKFAVDIRLLQSRGEVQEPMKKSQVGSSAMAYKKNPIRTERITGLARYLLQETGNAEQTAANQWLEHSLDDSSNRRLTIPHSFRIADGMLRTALNCARGLVVNENRINDNLNRQLPKLITENVIMEMVRAGGDRQELHERIRKHTREALGDEAGPGREAKELIDFLKTDPAFSDISDRIDELADPEQLSGRAPHQTREFLKGEVTPLLKDEADVLGESSDLSV